MKETGFQYGVDTDAMLSISTIHQYTNMEFNNAYHPPLMDVKMARSNSSSVSTLTSTSVTSKNDEVFSLQNPIHDQINYSYLSKSQSRYVCRAIDVMKTQVKLLVRKRLHPLILAYFLKDKSIK